jgi:hypothetical protein
MSGIGFSTVGTFGVSTTTVVVVVTTGAATTTSVTLGTTGVVALAAVTAADGTATGTAALGSCAPAQIGYARIAHRPKTTTLETRKDFLLMIFLL